MENITFSAVITPALRDFLQAAAKEADRTVSAELRQILQAEAERRQRQQAGKTTKQTN
jgi:hypothetical protein